MPRACHSRTIVPEPWKRSRAKTFASHSLQLHSVGSWIIMVRAMLCSPAVSPAISHLVNFNFKVHIANTYGMREPRLLFMAHSPLRLELLYSRSRRFSVSRWSVSACIVLSRDDTKYKNVGSSLMLLLSLLVNALYLVSVPSFEHNILWVVNVERIPLLFDGSEKFLAYSLIVSRHTMPTHTHAAHAGFNKGEQCKWIRSERSTRHTSFGSIRAVRVMRR